MIFFSRFAKDDCAQGDRFSATWEELADEFTRPRPNTLGKSALPLWSPATFERDYRHGDLLESVCALCFDLDEAPIPTPDEVARAVLAPAGILALYHTSSRATINISRGRLILPFSRRVTGPEYRTCWRVVAGLLPFAVGSAAKDPSRAWYVPREGPEGFYVSQFFSGLALDPDLLLGMGGGPEPDMPRAEIVAPIGFLAPADLPSEYQDAASIIGEACADACPEQGRRNSLSLALAGALSSSTSWKVIPASIVPALVHAICAVAGFKKLHKKYAGAVGTVDKKRGNGAISGWPVLRRDFPDVADAINAAFPVPDTFGFLK